MRRILVSLLGLIPAMLFAQAPPYVRQWATTNTPTVVTQIVDSIAYARPVTNWIPISGWYPGSDGLGITEVGSFGFFSRPPAVSQAFSYSARNGFGYRTNIVRWCFISTNSTGINVAGYTIGQGTLTSIATKQTGALVTQGAPVDNVASIVYSSITNYSHATIAQTNRFAHFHISYNAPPATNFVFFIGIQTEWYP